uniref:Putative nuclear receptor 2c2-associated protein n=1 Tax=Ixodes ricinus TaxID=34613 RepID=A0A6B0UKH1_IXORI
MDALLVYRRVSSVLNRDAKGFGKQHLTDKNEDTCWNSDQFQGGFAGKEMHLEVKTPGQPDATASAGDFYPEDSNVLQRFPLKMDVPISNLRIVFRSSTDMFGRIVLYKLDVIG